MRDIVIFFVLSFIVINQAYSAESSKKVVSEVGNENTSIAIPYREEKNISQQATPVLLVLFIFGLLAVIFLYFFKNKLSLVKHTAEKNIQVLEVRRLNTRLTVFHLKIKNKEMLVMQSGDNVKILDLNEKSEDPMGS